MDNNSNVSVEEVKKAIDEKIDCIILDVRTHGEYEKGKITGSINLPVDEVESKVESIISNKSTLIYVYCLSGSRSIIAAEEMKKLGYNNAFNVIRGLLAWRVKGYPVV